MDTKQRSFWMKIGVLLGGVLLLATGLWLRPQALAIYHLRAGERVLERALRPVYPDRLAPEQILDAAGLEVGMGHLKEAVRRAPHDVRPLRLLARAYLSLGQPEMALDCLQQAVSLQPEDSSLHLELADVYDSLGRTEDAVREYEAGGIGSRRFPLAANYLKLASAQVQYGSGELAILFWRKALEIDPDNLCALYGLYTIHREVGDTRMAARYEAQLRRIDPSNVPVPLDFRLAECQAQAMAALVGEGLWERETLRTVISDHLWAITQELPALMVERELRMLLVRWPEDPGILFALGELYQRRGDLGQAAEVYQEVIRIAPWYVQAYWRLEMVAPGETGIYRLNP